VENMTGVGGAHHLSGELFASEAGFVFKMQGLFF